jgi:hypothetical protein
MAGGRFPSVSVWFAELERGSFLSQATSTPCDFQSARHWMLIATLMSLSTQTDIPSLHIAAGEAVSVHAACLLTKADIDALSALPLCSFEPVTKNRAGTSAIKQTTTTK